MKGWGCAGGGPAFPVAFLSRRCGYVLLSPSVYGAPAIGQALWVSFPQHTASSDAIFIPISQVRK